MSHYINATSPSRVRQYVSSGYLLHGNLLAGVLLSEEFLVLLGELLVSLFAADLDLDLLDLASLQYAAFFMK